MVSDPTLSTISPIDTTAVDHGVSGSDEETTTDSSTTLDGGGTGDGGDGSNGDNDEDEEEDNDEGDDDQEVRNVEKADREITLKNVGEMCGVLLASHTSWHIGNVRVEA